ncbi:hypothetical protein [Nocardia panacis]|uniref:hypothetical protein n=1 Tax=Nocardia panacis TaxID=2340916 RepID=UPI0011C4899E|nr:hypothetical protein [Nocardia panacis]
MSGDLPGWFVQQFAAPRLGPYLIAAQRDGVPVASLYVWNLEIAASFYVPLHCLEISLRNTMHDKLKCKFGTDNWWSGAPLAPHDITKIDKAQSDAKRNHQSAGEPSADDIMSELSFGFWVSLLSRRYDRHLWVPILHRAFPHYRGSREILRKDLQTMVLLRNRIMHHEPIHHRHLAVDHQKVYQLLSYVCAELPAWVGAIDQVSATLARRPKADANA